MLSSDGAEMEKRDLSGFIPVLLLATDVPSHICLLIFVIVTFLIYLAWYDWAWEDSPTAYNLA